MLMCKLRYVGRMNSELMMLDLFEGLHELLILRGVTQAALRGGLARIGDWSDPTHCTNSTSQEQVAAAEQQTHSHF